MVLSTLQAVTIETDKSIYGSNENIVANFTEMLGAEDNWIGIYPAQSNNDWGNVLQWNWAEETSGVVNFTSLPIGEYEVRAFYENSYTVEAKYAFTIQENAVLMPVVIGLNQEVYLLDEVIEVTFENMLANAGDWIGIYPTGSSNDWGNVIDWTWSGGIEDGNVSFDALPVGNYDVRAFFNNGYNLEAQQSFSVTEEINDSVVLTSNKTNYAPNELIYVHFEKMMGSSDDWIGIYPAGASYEFENVVEWRLTGGLVEGNLSLDGLPAGSYDVRAFFDNSLTKEATVTITVEDIPVTSTVYEDAESGLNPNWVHVLGKYPMSRITPGFESEGAIRFQAYWIDSGTNNPTEFTLDFNNSTQKILEMDMRARSNPHFSFGVDVQTKEGPRRIIWDSFYNHNGLNRTVIPAFLSESNGLISLNNPAPDDYHYYGSRSVFRHYKIDVEKTLRNLEPDNELISIDTFVVKGGEYDNLKLSSH